MLRLLKCLLQLCNGKVTGVLDSVFLTLSCVRYADWRTFASALERLPTYMILMPGEEGTTVDQGLGL